MFPNVMTERLNSLALMFEQSIHQSINQINIRTIMLQIKLHKQNVEKYFFSTFSSLIPIDPLVFNANYITITHRWFIKIID